MPSIVGDFAGIYGYHDNFIHAGFLNKRYFVFTSAFKGQNRIYVADTDTQNIELIRIKAQHLGVGDIKILHSSHQMVILQYMEACRPAEILAVKFKQITATAEQFCNADNLTVLAIETHQFDDSPQSKFLKEKIKGV